LKIDGVQVRVASMYRGGRRPPVVFLHGFGSTKEDYADAALCALFEDRPIIAFDAPGCGDTECADLSAISISFLRQTAERVLEHYGIERFHLAGHSMGGLTALMLACGGGGSIISFTSIEGNVAPEDCFLSRQIITSPARDPDEFMAAFTERVWQMPNSSHPLYAASVAHKVRAEAVGPIFHYMVDLSDNEPLLSTFTGLPCAKMFVYGDQNRSLSYLGTLLRRGVQLAEIERSGHFPMYSNPVALWDRLGGFIDQSDLEGAHA